MTKFGNEFELGSVTRLFVTGLRFNLKFGTEFG